MCATLQVFSGGSVCYGYTTIPTYPSGQIGMMVCCKGQQLDARQPRQPAPGPHKDLGVPALRWVMLGTVYPLPPPPPTHTHYGDAIPSFRATRYPHLSFA